MPPLILRAGDGLSGPDVAEAAEALRGGKLLGFPTETVYGIGANPFDPDAVERVFSAKHRPRENPLLCHVSGREQALMVVSEMCSEAEALMRRFWPGPLTLVLPARENVPLVVRAGRPGVGVRCPDQADTLRVMEEAGLPIAGTSANVSGRPSAVRPEDALAEVGEALDILIDAGECRLGVESTVIDVTVSPAVIWRVGAVAPEEIRAALIEAGVDLAVREAPAALSGYLRSRPNLRVLLVRGEGGPADRAADLMERLSAEGRKAGLLVTGEKPPRQPGQALEIGLGDEPERRLYTALREAENAGLEVLVFVETGDAVSQRIGRRLAASGGEEA